MPNRILKESICTSDSIDGLTWFEEVLFYRLMVSCDDFGRFDGRAAIIKNRLFPLKENLTIKAVSAAINALASKELVSLYEFEGKPYLCLPTWNEHQTIRAKKSKYPAPEDGAKSSASNCKQMQADVPVIQSNTKSNPNPNTNIDGAGKPHLSPRGEYGWVKLSDDQMNRLVTDLGESEAKACIRYVDESAQQTGNKNKWKDWNLTVRKCHREGWHKKSGATAHKRSPNNIVGMDFQPSEERIRKNQEFLEKFFRENGIEPFEEREGKQG